MKRASMPARSFCLAVVLCLCLAWGNAWAVPVGHVFDGDTFALADGRRVRLVGIDAPELAHGGNEAQYFANEAKAALVRLVGGADVRLAPAGQGEDRFGRILAEVFLPDGRSVNEMLLAQGAAYFFWHRDLSPELSARFLAAQRQAMAAGRGFWPRIAALPAPGRPYVGNTASRRFHDPRCPDAARVSPRHRVFLTTMSQALGEGYAPARDCSPWPAAR